MKLLTVLSIIAIINLSACNSTKPNLKDIEADTKVTKTNNSDAVAQITDTYWKLVKLAGKDIADAENPHDQPHFLLNTEKNKVTGNGGCNGFFGNFTLDEGNKHLKFEQLGSTKRMCADSVVNEHEFMQTLGKVDKYRISNDMLELSKDNGEALAVFKALTNQQ